MTNSLTDQELFHQFSVKKEQSGYVELYKRYFPSLAKYAAWTIGDKEKGKDLAQKIMLKLYERPELYDPGRSLKTWLFTILKNQIKNEWRNQTNRKRILDLIPKQNETYTTDQDDENRIQSIYDALNHLSENHKEIFLLKYSNNLTIKEIGDILNISEGTVKSRIFYSTRAIREHINNNNKSTNDE